MEGVESWRVGWGTGAGGFGRGGKAASRRESLSHAFAEALAGQQGPIAGVSTINARPVWDELCPVGRSYSADAGYLKHLW